MSTADHAWGSDWAVGLRAGSSAAGTSSSAKGVWNCWRPSTVGTASAPRPGRWACRIAGPGCWSRPSMKRPASRWSKPRRGATRAAGPTRRPRPCRHRGLPRIAGPASPVGGRAAATAGRARPGHASPRGGDQSSGAARSVAGRLRPAATEPARARPLRRLRRIGLPPARRHPRGPVPDRRPRADGPAGKGRAAPTRHVRRPGGEHPGRPRPRRPGLAGAKAGRPRRPGGRPHRPGRHCGSALRGRPVRGCR